MGVRLRPALVAAPKKNLRRQWVRHTLDSLKTMAGPLFKIEVCLLVYIASFLNDRDRAALAVTCVGFLDALTHESVRTTLMLGGLKVRLVETLAQFEDWVTLARVMPKGHKHAQAIVTRGVWKGCLEMFTRFPKLVGDRERALAIYAGHKDIIARIELDAHVAAYLGDMVAELVRPIDDTVLGILTEFAVGIGWALASTVLGVAASTRSDAQMRPYVVKFAETYGADKLKGWCVRSGMVSLAHEAFPDAALKPFGAHGVASSAAALLCRQPGAVEILAAYSPDALREFMAGRTLRNTPKAVLDWYIDQEIQGHVPLRNGYMAVGEHKRSCSGYSSKYGGNAYIIRQALVDVHKTKITLETPTILLANYLFGSPYDSPKTAGSYHERAQLPSFDWETHIRSEIIRRKDAALFAREVPRRLDTLLYDEEVFRTLLEEKIDEGWRQPSVALAAVIRAGFAQDNIQALIAAGYKRQVAEWVGPVNERQAHVLWEMAFETPSVRNAKIVHHLSRAQRQRAVDAWLVDCARPLKLLSLAKGTESVLADLDYTGVRDMLARPSAAVVGRLETMFFYTAFGRNLFLDVVIDHQLRTQYLKTAKGQRFASHRSVWRSHPIVHLRKRTLAKIRDP